MHYVHQCWATGRNWHLMCQKIKAQLHSDCATARKIIHDLTYRTWLDDARRCPLLYKHAWYRLFNATNHRPNAEHKSAYPQELP